MNERINELAEEAEINFESHPQHQGIDTAVITPSDLKKFAELIVLECINTVSDCSVEYSIRPQIVNEIKKHFGVEE